MTFSPVHMYVAALMCTLYDVNMTLLSNQDELQYG